MNARSDAPSDAPYAVLARKYRPQDFSGLIGQEALVRVLTNAFERDRIPHAMLMTGVRGVGKTSTARIVAKGLNCSGADGPTVNPCGVCDNCVAIAESRHVDVIEMDAASRTGIDDIREIIESVRYRANIGRYKIYIIDEVHMLSKSAFNGLLKTLEEPPPHVKFILATTDSHKLPATVLSRCMRFDLRRVEPERMVAHLDSLCKAESVSADQEALALVARASEGSVRDALSLLDQAIAHGAGEVKADALREMLGLSDSGRVFDLMKAILEGSVGEALDLLGGLYRDGGDPAAILRDLASACHLTALSAAAPTRGADPTLSPAERAMSAELATKTSQRVLSRFWQMLLKAIEETETAPAPLAAAEMAVIRMTHISELPTPEDVIRRLNEAGAGTGGAANGAARSGSGAPQGGGGRAAAGASNREQGSVRGAAQGGETAHGSGEGPRLVASGGGAAMASAQPVRRTAPQNQPQVFSGPQSFEEIVALAREKRDGKLLVELERYVRPGPLGPYKFEFTPAPGAPASLAHDLRDRLKRWTGAMWSITVANGHDGPTVEETKDKDTAERRAAALEDPLVRAALEAFPGAELSTVRDVSVGNDAADDEPLLEIGGDDLFFDGEWELDPHGGGYVDEDDESED